MDWGCFAERAGGEGEKNAGRSLMRDGHTQLPVGLVWATRGAWKYDSDSDSDSDSDTTRY